MTSLNFRLLSIATVAADMSPKSVADSEASPLTSRDLQTRGLLTARDLQTRGPLTAKDLQTRLINNVRVGRKMPLH